MGREREGTIPEPEGAYSLVAMTVGSDEWRLWRRWAVVTRGGGLVVAQQDERRQRRRWWRHEVVVGDSVVWDVRQDGRTNG